MPRPLPSANLPSWFLAALRWLLAAVALVVMATTPHFLTPQTLSTILALASIVGVLAVGQSFVLIGGGFDLSQGAMVALTAALAATLAVPPPQGWGQGAWLVLAATLTFGALLGTLNGLCVAYLGTNPFVTTLSTLLIYRGAAFLLLEGEPRSGVTAFSLLEQRVALGGLSLPARSFLFPLLAVLAWFVLRRMVLGRHLYATGGNATAARLSGIRTRALQALTFAISGATAALAAIMYLSWIRSVKPDTGTGYELDSIAACVVGGISLQGGRGSVLGAAAGCLLLQALGNWITIRGLQDEYRSFLIGIVILVFAGVDALSRRASGR